MRIQRFAPATFLLLLPLVFLFFACDQEPTAVDTSTLSYAKGGTKGKGDGESGKDLEFGEYTVEWIDADQQGFTDVSSVDEAVYQHLRTDPEVNRVFVENGNDDKVQLDPEDYFGCPDGSLPCNRVTLSFTGTGYTLYGSFANMVVGCGLGSDPDLGCMNDMDLVDRRLASTAGGASFPSLPWTLLEDAIITDRETGVSEFTYYWQGQRGLDHYAQVGEETVRGKIRPIYEYTEVWDYLPDIHPVGTSETPVFGFGARLSSLSGNTTFLVWPTSRREENCTPDWDDCRGEFQGTSGAGPLYMWIDLWDVDPTGRVEFAIQAFREDPASFSEVSEGKLDYTAPDLPSINPESHSRVMMVSPDGTRSMLNPASTSRRSDDYDYKVGVAESRYLLDLVDYGCYEFHALSLVARERNAPTWQETFDLNRLVWTPTVPGENVFHVDVDPGGETSMALEGCPRL
jgi:hypothetical protein